MKRALQNIFIAILCVVSSCQDDCTITNNRHIDFSDLEAHHGQPEAACCTLCQNTAGCKGFSWDESEGGTCFLKAEPEFLRNVRNGTNDQHPTIVNLKGKSLPGNLIPKFAPYNAEASARAEPAQIISRHNQKRRLHRVGDLRFNSDIQARADRCCRYYASINQIDHSCRDSSGYGENLYAGSFSDPFNQAFDRWYDENQNYDYSTGTKKRGRENEEIGHFTQIVWKNSQQIGCAMAERGNQKYVCCMYSPPGNYRNQYTQNVLRP